MNYVRTALGKYEGTPRSISARDKFEEYFAVSSFFPFACRLEFIEQQGGRSLSYCVDIAGNCQFLMALLDIKVQNKTNRVSSLQGLPRGAINLRTRTSGNQVVNKSTLTVRYSRGV